MSIVKLARRVPDRIVDLIRLPGGVRRLHGSRLVPQSEGAVLALPIRCRERASVRLGYVVLGCLRVPNWSM